MASDGVEAVAEYIKSGKKPESKDTGEKLVTDQAGSGRSFDHVRRGAEDLLGLISPRVRSLIV